MLQLGRVLYTCSHTPGANSKSGERLHALGAEGILHVNLLKRPFYFLEEKGPVYCCSPCSAPRPAGGSYFPDPCLEDPCGH